MYPLMESGTTPVKAESTTLDITISTRTRGLRRYFTLLFPKRRASAIASIIKDYGQPSAREIMPPAELTARRGGLAGSWNFETRFRVEDEMLERDSLMLVIVILHDRAFGGKKISVEGHFPIKYLLDRSMGNKEGEQVGEVLTRLGGGNIHFGFKFGPRVMRRTSDELHGYAGAPHGLYPRACFAPSAPYMGYLNEANTDAKILVSS